MKNLRFTILLVIILALFYFPTVAPGLTWANDGADGGDLITAAKIGGVPHPGGYPTYILIASVFQHLPAENLAYKTNIMSVVFAIASALLLYFFVLQTLDGQESQPAKLSSFFAAIAFGLSPVIWSQAVITEVYTLEVFFVMMALSISQTMVQKVNSGWKYFFFGILLGLGLGTHLTFIFVALGSIVRIIWSNDNRHKIYEVAAIGIGLVCGVSIFLALPIRATSNPPVNWGNPVTLEGFVWLVSGRLYNSSLVLLDQQVLLDHLRGWAYTIETQFTVIGLVLAAIGLAFFAKHKGTALLLVGLFVAYSAFSIIYQTQDSYVYLLPAILCLAVFLGWGINGILTLPMLQGKMLFYAFGTSILLGLISIGFHTAPKVDASRDHRAEEFISSIETQLPREALVYVTSDRAIFASWYAHFGMNLRPDIAVIAPTLLSAIWYLENLETTYPNLKVPFGNVTPTAISMANPSRPVCFVTYTTKPQIDCSQ